MFFDSSPSRKESQRIKETHALNRKKQKLVQHDQSSKSPYKDLLADPGLESTCSRERSLKNNAWKTRASQPQVVYKPIYFNAFNKKCSKRMDECNNIKMHGSVASNSMNACSNYATRNLVSDKIVHPNMNCVNMNAKITRTNTSKPRNTKHQQQKPSIPKGKNLDHYD